MKKKKLQVFKIILMVVLVIVSMIGIGTALYMIWEKPPEYASYIPTEPAASEATEPLSKNENETDEAVSAVPEEDDTGKPQNDRNDGMYTILFVGKDRGGNNTDTIMFCRFDTQAHSINVISIPRDTYTNIVWYDSRKINAIYSLSRYYDKETPPMDRLILEVQRLTGVQADCYVTIDLNTFIEAVDIIGGIRYDVPVDMDYDDYNQDLHIHLTAGDQILDGYSAMGLWRFRSGFRQGDIDRLDNQHMFLRAVADQFLSLGTVPHLDELISLVAANTETNLSASNLAWFARQFFKCDVDGINFYTMPWIGSNVNDLSYVFPDLEPWLEMINSALNPYNREITREDLDCIFINREENAYEPSNGNFVDPSYLHAWRYYPTSTKAQREKEEREAAEKDANGQENGKQNNGP